MRVPTLTFKFIRRLIPVVLSLFGSFAVQLVVLLKLWLPESEMIAMGMFNHNDSV